MNQKGITVIVYLNPIHKRRIEVFQNYEHKNFTLTHY